MELAVVTDEIDLDLGHALNVMLEYGVRAVELRAIWDKNIADAPPEYLDRAKKLIDDRGMHVIGIATPFYKCHLPGEESEGPVGPLHSASARGLGDQIALLEHCFEIARHFDTHLIRIFSFWKHGSLTPAIEDQIVDALAEPVALAEREGFILGMENEHACYLGSGAQTVRVLEKVSSPALRAIWDPGNAIMTGEKPYPTGYEAIKDFITHVHVKDAALTPGDLEPHWTVVGEGEIDYKGQIAALKDSGYPGYLPLETHYRGGPTREASSRACLEGLQRLVRGE